MSGPWNKAFGAAALVIATAIGSVAAQQAAAPGNGFLIDIGACVGDYTAGGFAAGRYRLSSGLAIGLELDATSETSIDPVEGLSGGYSFYVSAYATGGWDFRLGGHLTLGASLLVGAEAAFLTERVVDRAHGIDQSYSTLDYMFDPACRIEFSWYPWESIGLSASALVSLYDLRKSLIGLCLSLREASAHSSVLPST